MQVSEIVVAAAMTSYLMWGLRELGWSRGALPALAAGSTGPWIALLDPSVEVVTALKLSLVASAFAVFTMTNWQFLRPAPGDSLATWLGLRGPREP